MSSGKFIAYYRVSTDRQGRSGLGLEAQQIAIEQFLNGNGWEIIGEYTEIESGKRNDRPELEKAIEACRSTGATLIVAKLDRLSRNAAFLLALRDSNVEFKCADMPEADRFTVGILALVAEREAEMTSKRTKEALAAAKARGVKLGGRRPGANTDTTKAREANKRKASEHAAKIRPIVDEIKEAGLTSLGQIAKALNARGIKTARGGQWHPTTVKNVLDRLTVEPLGS